MESASAAPPALKARLSWQSLFGPRTVGLFGAALQSVRFGPTVNRFTT